MTYRIRCKRRQRNEKLVRVFRSDDCKQCGVATKYVSKYDRFACEACDVWTDLPCGCKPEDECPFEVAPDKPSLM